MRFIAPFTIFETNGERMKYGVNCRSQYKDDQKYVVKLYFETPEIRENFIAKAKLEEIERAKAVG